MNDTVTLDPVRTDDPDSREAPLVRRLVEQFGAHWVSLATHADFCALPGDQVLFFTGDPVRFPECLDVAVVLPELQRAFPGRLTVGVVRRGDEDAIARRWGSQRWPALVFLRQGEYVGTVSGMLDWTDYLARVADLLDTPSSRPPIPLMGSGSAPSCH